MNRQIVRSVCVPALLTLFASAARAQTTVPIAVDNRGLPVDGCFATALSSDGRYVALIASRSMLDTQNYSWPSYSHSFRHDRHTGTNVEIVRGIGGTDPDAYDIVLDLTGDGLGALIGSGATNLVAGDTSLALDVFYVEIDTGNVERISRSFNGVESDGDSYANAMSPDGRFIAFTSFATNIVPGDLGGHQDVFAHDRVTGVTQLVSRGIGGQAANGDSKFSAISADGRLVVFTSHASDLVAGDTNGCADLFVRDLWSSITTRISASVGGAQGDGPVSEFGLGISDNGRFVVFASDATNLVPGDTNGVRDIFSRDLQSGTITCLTFSGDGFSDTFVFSQISADGRYTVFASHATNLVPGDANASADMFVHDRTNQSLELISRSSSGTLGDLGSSYGVLSADGRVVAFASSATNLVIGSGYSQGSFGCAFLHDRTPAAVLPPQRYCTAKVNSAGCTPSIGLAGVVSASSDNAFVTAADVLGRRAGMLFWGLAPQATPFGGGTRCVAGPVRRTGVQDSGGPDSPYVCWGYYSFHFTSAYLQANALGAGATFFAQYWSRDPRWLNANEKVGLTDAVQVTVAP